MKNEEVRKIVREAVSEAINELKRQNMIRQPNDEIYSHITDRLLSFYEAGERDYDMQTALGELKGDYYFMIIPLFFSERKTLEHIAEIFEVDVSTITRNKKRLCMELHKILGRL